MSRAVILVNGVSGQLGSAIQRMTQFAPDDVKSRFVFLTREQMDLSNPDSVAMALNQHKPTMIVNCAAYVAVDKAEDERELATRVNVDAVAQMAEWAKKNQSHMIHFSTDYVYSGAGQAEHKESDILAPVNFYGQTKQLSERALMASEASYHIFRTSWVHSYHGSNFVRTMYRLFKERETLNVVNDQVGAPTYAVDLANVISQICLLEPKRLQETQGVYNYSNLGQTNWFEFATHLLNYFKAQKLQLKTAEILPIDSSQYPMKAKRPLNSRMDKSLFIKNFGFSIPTWQSGADRCVLKILETENLI